MRNIAIMIVLSFVLISCEKEESEKEESLDIENPKLVIENTDIPLLSKMLSGGGVFMEYTYNDRNLLLEEKNKHHYSLHTYDDNNQLIASEIYWDKSSISSDIRVIEELANREEWVSPDNTPLRACHSFKYNTEEIYRYTPEGIAELQSTTEYEYDNMHNPFRAFKRLITPGKYTNQNNIVKRTYTLPYRDDEFSEKVRIREYSYEYNDDGYPVMVNGVTEYVYRD